MNEDLTWEELRLKPSGTILHDEFDEGIRFIVMRGPIALCGYAGIPIDHPLAGQSYEDLSIDAHGGLTFSRNGRGKWPEGYYWYGWDYGHSGDYCFYFDETPIGDEKGKKWLVKDVIDDSWHALYEFKELMKLTEKIRKEEK